MCLYPLVSGRALFVPLPVCFGEVFVCASTRLFRGGLCLCLYPLVSGKSLCAYLPICFGAMVAGKPKTSRGQSFPQAPGGTRYENATLRAQAGRRRTSRGQSFPLPGGMPVGGRGFALCQQEKTVRNFTTATRMTSRDESLPLPGVTWSRNLVISFISVTHRP